MRTMILASTMAAGLLFAAMPAQASGVELLPLAGGDAPAVTLVMDGCGPGFHRGPYGHCRPNGYFRPAYGYGYGWHRGWHRGWHHW